MRVKRRKHAKKILSFYHNAFRLREPYQVLVDGTFTQAALQTKINIKEQLPKYLDGSVLLVTTRCILAEAKEIGSRLHGALLILERYQCRKCGHQRGDKLVPAAECIKSLVGLNNEHHYIIASQDQELKGGLRQISGVPLLHITHNAIMLENPTPLSRQKAEETLALKTAPSSHEKETLDKLAKLLPKERGRIASGRIQKRKIARGPNPLSVKKKKAIVAEGMKLTKKKTRRRKRKTNDLSKT
ncbi:rRNA-processing protein UTP23 homolog [Oscarella lobularis]|uniref:rRNA-processing protein UTP23 homolog n=1 Tax=Oscarella lobularis TaxID=121494 RepID=UPI0033137176